MGVGRFGPLHDWFLRYVDRCAGDRAGTGIEMKRRHSLRVSEASAEIARELGWGDDDVELAEIAGLLHDAGRFAQLERFGTLNDATSVDHGEAGARLIAEAAPVEGLEAQTLACVLATARHHNQLSTPSGLDPASLRVLRLVRDADKLDIWRLSNERLDCGPARGEFDIFAGLEWGPPAPAVAAAVCAGRAVANREVANLTDLVLMQLSWVFDVNHLPTMRRVRDERILERRIEPLSRYVPPEPLRRAALGHRDAMLRDRRPGRAGPPLFLEEPPPLS